MPKLNIKRGEACGLTKEKFEEIRGAPYGNEVIYKSKFGYVASWLTWNRNKNGHILSVPPTEDWQIGSFWDGRFPEWSEELASRLTTNIVFVGLNMSSDEEPNTEYYFQNARGDNRIVRTFFGTEAEGGYFTDIIKQDKRIITYVNNKGGTSSKSELIEKYLKSNPSVIIEHIKIFKEELDLINKDTAERPLLIVFGDIAYRVLEWGINGNKKLRINSGLLKKGVDFKERVKIWHYSTETRRPLVEYIIDTKVKLNDYLTIPSPMEKIKSIAELNNEDYIVDPNVCIGKFIGFGRQNDGHENIVIEYSDKKVLLPKDNLKNIMHFINRKGLPLPSLSEYKEYPNANVVNGYIEIVKKPKSTLIKKN